MPALTIYRSAPDSVVISWPASAVGWSLERNPDLAPGNRAVLEGGASRSATTCRSQSIRGRGRSIAARASRELSVRSPDGLGPARAIPAEDSIPAPVRRRRCAGYTNRRIRSASPVKACGERYRKPA